MRVFLRYFVDWAFPRLAKQNPVPPDQMKIVDARSGREFVVSNQHPTAFAKNEATIIYGDREFIDLHFFEPGALFARILVSGFADGSEMKKQWVKMPVRWFHPRFPGQQIAFIPS